MKLKRLIVGTLAPIGLLVAGGGSGKPGVPTPPAPNSAEIRISNEVAPAGGTAQIKFALTNPQPILSGGADFLMAIDGVSLSSVAGDAAGAAVYQHGTLTINAISPLGDLGLSEYPLVTLTVQVPGSAKSGTVYPLDFSAIHSLVTAAGPLNVTTKPGTLTVGGAFSIHNVEPGGGTWPAGTNIRIEGTGFTTGAQLRTPQMKFSSYRVVSPTEIDFTLKEQTTLDNQPVQVTNGGQTQTYYSYLRGVPLREPSRTLLKTTDPIFQQLTHALAQAGPFAAQDAGQYVALALQNPNNGPAVATLNLLHVDGTTISTTILLPSGARIVDDIAALVGVSALQSGDVLSLSSTSPIQILGLSMDENLGTATPFLPSF